MYVLTALHPFITWINEPTAWCIQLPVHEIIKKMGEEKRKEGNEMSVEELRLSSQLVGVGLKAADGEGQHGSLCAEVQG